MTSPSLGLAFLAGLVSCLSPCVFPLLPGYMAYLGRQAVMAPATPGGVPGPSTVARSRAVVLAGVAFVLGFSTVFVVFFYILQALNVLFFVHQRRLVDVVAGIIVIILGLQTLGIIRWAPLLRERRLHPTMARGLPGAFMLGITFAAGWTPCLGPQLGAILSLTAAGFAGLPFMLVYCLGLAVPFLAVAALTGRAASLLRAINAHMRLISIIGGLVLLLFGVLLLTDNFTYFNRFAGQAPFDL
jgi:cytochrome c-type biogenesis protein